VALQPNQQQAVALWLKSKCPNMACPACGGTDWSPMAGVVMPAPQQLVSTVEPRFSGSVFSNLPPRTSPQPHAGAGGPGFPVIAVACRCCAYVRFFSAEVMGVGV
jgi:hypothetical protein